MASQVKQATYAEEMDQKYADWVYLVPGFILIVGGLIAFAFLMFI